MSIEPVISIENLSKFYRLGVIGSGTLREDVNRWVARLLGRPDPTTMVGGLATPKANYKEQLWALKEINLQVGQGEILGVIGSNGAGKSTLLKILSRITAPTSGQAIIRGRVGSLLEVGTGFHMELTGRENIFLNGTILGMSRAEVAEKLDEIVDFAGMERFIDTPAKRYSSGMAVRLAFAVAAHLEPEVLIVDEVLAVGDTEFQQKCIGKMQSVAGSGRTVLFVSHNLAAVSRLCTRAIWLDRGRLREDGPVDKVIEMYEAHAAVGSIDTSEDESERQITLDRIEVTALDSEAGEIEPGASVRFVVSGRARQRYSEMHLGFGIYDEEGRRLSLLESRCRESGFDFHAGKFSVQCAIESLPLTEGRYTLNVALMQGKTLLDARSQAATFRVHNHNQLPGDAAEFGPLRLRHSWAIEQTDGSD